MVLRELIATSTRCIPAPLAAIAELRGRVWRRVVTKAELPDVARRHHVICTKLLGGGTLVHVYAESLRAPDFDPAEPDLEDVYFSVMARHQGAGAEPLTTGATS